MRTNKRYEAALESFTSAASTIGDITHGMHKFAVTRGQFSMIDAILATIDQIGPSHISVWTWTVASYEVQCIERLMIDKRILSARLIIDRGAQKKNADIIRNWQSIFGEQSVRWVVNHAKIATLWNGQFKVLLRGSFNLNYNPRFENFDISEGCDGFDLVRKIEDELPILTNSASQSEIIKGSKLNDTFSDEQLELFGLKQLKVWSK